MSYIPCFFLCSQRKRIETICKIWKSESRRCFFLCSQRKRIETQTYCSSASTISSFFLCSQRKRIETWIGGLIGTPDYVSSFVRKGSGLKLNVCKLYPPNTEVSSFVRKGSGLKHDDNGNGCHHYAFLPLFAKEAD